MKKFLFLTFAVVVFTSVSKNVHASYIKAKQNNNTSKSCCYDLIIIGGGSSAFSAALAASKFKKKILLINGGLPLGGTCVNVGCMPSKYLVRAAESYHNAKKSPFFGVETSSNLNFKFLIQGKKKYISESQKNNYVKFSKTIKGLDIIEGFAKFKSKSVICVNKNEYTSKNFIIATGAIPRIPDIKGLKDVGFHTNRSLFNVEKNFNTITIIGAGYIGLEIASIYSQLGVKVRVINKNERLLSKCITEDLSEELEKYLSSLGIEFYHNTVIESVVKKGFKKFLKCKKRGFQDFEIIEKNHIVVAAGIDANTDFLDLKKINLKLDKNGKIVVNNKMETSIKNIYAIGDCANSPAYLYTAVKEGEIAANNIFSKFKKNISYYALPWVVFTNPEISGVGINENFARENKIPYEIVKIPLSSIAKTSTTKDTRGIIKIIKHKQKDTILGARIISANAGELIGYLSILMKKNITITELKNLFFPYLTLSEGLKIAANEFK